jgi:hypothetical protein
MVTETPKCSAVSSRTGKPCNRYAIAGGTVCIMHGGATLQVKAAAAARLRAMVNPALSVLEYAMEQKEKDIRGALAAAKEVLDRAKPEDGEEGTEVRNTVNVRYFDPPEN